MTRDADIVADILQRAIDVVRAEVGPRALDQITAERLIAHIGALEVPIRREWGSQKPYVAKRDESAKAAALAEVQRTGRVAEASSRHGVSRATLYRLLANR